MESRGWLEACGSCCWGCLEHLVPAGWCEGPAVTSWRNSLTNLLLGSSWEEGFCGLVGRPRSFIPQTFMASTLPGSVCPWGMNSPRPGHEEVTVQKGAGSLMPLGAGPQCRYMQGYAEARAGVIKEASHGLPQGPMSKTRCLPVPPLQGAQVQSLLGELRSHMAKHDTLKNKTIKNPRLPRGGRKGAIEGLGDRADEPQPGGEVGVTGAGVGAGRTEYWDRRGQTSKGTGFPCRSEGFQGLLHAGMESQGWAAEVPVTLKS